MIYILLTICFLATFFQYLLFEAHWSTSIWKFCYTYPKIYLCLHSTPSLASHLISSYLPLFLPASSKPQSINTLFTLIFLLLQAPRISQPIAVMTAAPHTSSAVHHHGEQGKKTHSQSPQITHPQDAIRFIYLLFPLSPTSPPFHRPCSSVTHPLRHHRLRRLWPRRHNLRQRHQTARALTRRLRSHSSVDRTSRGERRRGGSDVDYYTEWKWACGSEFERVGWGDEVMR